MLHQSILDAAATGLLVGMVGYIILGVWELIKKSYRDTANLPPEDK